MQDEENRVGYCTNVHSGGSLEETMHNLDRHATEVARRLGEDRLGIGLWLPEGPAREVMAGGGARDLRDRLESMGLYVFTLNGFPQGDFHAKVVKHAVYQPGWDSVERLEYTMQLAVILSELLPEDLSEGSISTLPLGWRAGFEGHETAIARLEALAEGLARIEDRTGRLIHVDLEPEPGCVLDRAVDVVDLFGRLPERARRHLRVCHDVCHSAVMFEEQKTAIETYRSEGISVGKIQVSSCPEIDFEAIEEDEREFALSHLASFAEPRYLHQTTIMSGDGNRSFHEDLGQVVERRPARGRWRVHFHVPVFARSLGPVGTTQRDIAACISAFEGNLPMLEVETYAWGVLPEGLFSDDLAGGIAEEIRYTRSLLTEERA